MSSDIYNFNFDISDFDENGMFEGYASLFDQVDTVKDQVAKGAFKKTLETYRKQGRMPALLWQHDTTEPIGAWKEIFEDEKGLYVRGQLFIEDIPKAKQAYKLLKEKALSGLSIGFKATETTLDPHTGIRTLLEIDLLEISLVTFPALETARIATVKQMLLQGTLPEVRVFEAFLRDAGFSRKQAKAIMADGYRSVKQRDAVQGDNPVTYICDLADKIRALI